MEKSVSNESLSEETHPAQLDGDQHDKAFRKVDLHLMPLLMALYLIANLDRFVASQTPFDEGPC